MISIIVALACSVLSASGTIATKLLSGELPLFTFAFLCYGLAALCLFPFVLLSKEKESFNIKYLPIIMFLGFSMVFVFNALFFNAVYYSSATSVSVIMATNPILTLLISSVILRVVPNRYQLVSFMLSFAGAVLVITKGNMEFSLVTGSIGEFLMLLGVLIQIMYAMVLKKVSTHFSPLFLAFATMASGILFVIPFVVNQEFVDVLRSLTGNQWGIIAFMGCLGNAFSYYLYSFAIKSMGPTRTNLIVFGTIPIFVMILASLILGETISVWQFVGATLVVSSLAVGLPHTR